MARPLIERQITPGLIIGLLEDGERTVVPLGSTSYDKNTPPDERTMYEIGSITKVFTALLLADAEARGELSENDTLAEHLPEGVPLHEVNPANPIKLVDLSGHSSGLPRMPNNIRPTDPMNPYADYTPERLWAFLTEVKPAREPGEGYEYSNLAAGLLGTVLALEAGTTYERLMLDRVAGPLGMSQTTITLSDEQRARLAPPHRNGIPMHNWDFDALAGCGAIRSDVTDMLTLAEATLAARADDAAETDALKTAPDTLVTALRSVQDRRFEPGGSQPDVALGWHLTGPTGRVVWHNGGTGGYSTFLAVNTLNKTAVVVLANGSSQEITTLGFGIIKAMGRPVPGSSGEDRTDDPDDEVP